MYCWTSADDDGGDRRAADRPEAADDDDDEREDQQARPLIRPDDVEVDAAEHAGDRRRDAADREDERERLAHVDAERLHHRAVLDAGADDQPVARLAAGTAAAETSTTAAVAISTQRSFGMCAPPMSVVRCSHGGTTNVFASGPQMPVIERDERELQADRDEHLLDVTRVERPDQNQLDERREDAAADEAEQRAEEPAPRIEWIAVEHVRRVHHVP